MRCRQLLIEKEIPARVVRRGDDRMVEVQVADRDVALSLIEEHRETIHRKHDRRDKLQRRRAVYLTAMIGMQILVLLVGGAAFLRVQLSAVDRFFVLMLLLLAAGCAGYAGWLYARRRNKEA
jgi:hypothetical protein